MNYRETLLPHCGGDRPHRRRRAWPHHPAHAPAPPRDLADISPGLAGLMAARFGAPLATTDHRELLAAGADALLMAVPVPPEEIVADARRASNCSSTSRWRGRPGQACRLLAATETATAF